MSIEHASAAMATINRLEQTNNAMARMVEKLHKENERIKASRDFWKSRATALRPRKKKRK